MSYHLIKSALAATASSSVLVGLRKINGNILCLS